MRRLAGGRGLRAQPGCRYGREMVSSSLARPLRDLRPPPPVQEEHFAAADYPWAGAAVRSALLLEDGIADLDPVGGVGAPAERLSEPVVDIDLVEQALAAEGAAPLAERTLVLAVGSNQTPQAIARKYRRAGGTVPAATPFVRCTVHELAVGHVAHIAAPGYVPAAPYRAPGQRMELVATWFDDEQLAVIDATEPNYDRIRLAAAQHPLTLATGQEPTQVHVYASRWGVLARDGVPLPLRHRQQELFDELSVLTGDERFVGEAAEVCTRMAAEPEALRAQVSAHGLIAPDGLARS